MQHNIPLMGGLLPKTPTHNGIYKNLVIYEFLPPLKFLISTYHRDISSPVIHDIELSDRVNDA